MQHEFALFSMAQGNGTPMDTLAYLTPWRPQKPTLLPHAWTADHEFEFLAAQRAYSTATNSLRSPVYTNSFPSAFPLPQISANTPQGSPNTASGQAGRLSTEPENEVRSIDGQPQLAHDTLPKISIEASSRSAQTTDLPTDEESSFQFAGRQIARPGGFKDDFTSGMPPATIFNTRGKSAGTKRAREQYEHEMLDSSVATEPNGKPEKVRGERTNSYNAGRERTDGLSSSEGSGAGPRDNEVRQGLELVVKDPDSDERTKGAKSREHVAESTTSIPAPTGLTTMSSKK